MSAKTEAGVKTGLVVGSGAFTIASAILAAIPAVNVVVAPILLLAGIGTGIAGAAIDPQRTATREAMEAQGYSHELAVEYAKLQGQPDEIVTGAFYKWAEKGDSQRMLAARLVLAERQAAARPPPAAAFPVELFAWGGVLGFLGIGALVVLSAKPKGVARGRF